MSDKDKSATWLHISDFHFKQGRSYERDTVTNALLKSLKGLTSRFGKPDFIIASGDVAFSGKEEEYKEASAFFGALLDETKVDRQNLIVVPGNHDVSRIKGRGLIRSFSTGQEAIEYFSLNEPIKHVESKLTAYAQ